MADEPLFAPLESRPAAEAGKQPLDRVINRYLELYAGSSSHTARAKKLDCLSFLRFLSSERCSDGRSPRVDQWNHSSTSAFVEFLLRKGEAPATVARRVATLKHLGRTLAERVPGFVNPARDIRAPKVTPLRPKAVPRGELAQVRRALDRLLGKKPSYRQLRDRLVVLLLIETGLRVDEVCHVRAAQLDAPLRWIMNVRTKGRRFRNVYLATPIRADLRQFLAARELELNRRAATLSARERAALPLLISHYGASVDQSTSWELSPRSIWRLVRKVSQKTKLHPHLLRHSFALDLLEDSRDIRLVAQALGHSDVRTTMRYTERRDQEVAIALEKARGKQKKR